MGEVPQDTPGASRSPSHAALQAGGHVTVYGGWSRGFRSGGFNQTVWASVARRAASLGVNDLFDAEVCRYLRARRQGGVSDRRNAGLDVYHTKSTNGYFFVFLAAEFDPRHSATLDATTRASSWN